MKELRPTTANLRMYVRRHYAADKQLTVRQPTSDVITAVPKFAAERSHPVTDAPTFQHAAPGRAENAH